MRFDLDHDWQGNLATPRSKVGDRTKIHLLLLLAIIWLLMGLTGHSPWKPYESHSISLVQNLLDGSSWLTPLAASDSQLMQPPLYPISAAIFAQLFGGLIQPHDAARLASGVWMLLTLVITGLTGRELWGAGAGRQAVLILISCLGLVLFAHTLMPDVANLTGLALAFYALALSKRRPYRAALLLAIASGICFLSVGLMPVLIIWFSAGILFFLFSPWRQKAFKRTLWLGAIGSIAAISVWPLLCFIYGKQLFFDWAYQQFIQFDELNHLRLLRNLAWAAWPALPLAIWGCWRFRQQLAIKPRFQLMIVFFMITWLLSGLTDKNSELGVITLLIPLTAIAAGSIETLKRGASGALNWFGLVLFGLITVIIWLGWLAMMTGNPAKLKERILFLTGASSLTTHWFSLIIAIAITLLWLLTLLRTQRTNRALATNWAVGLTCVWTLLMTLWLPLIDQARSYADVFGALKSHLPSQISCMTSRGVGTAQRDLLHYYLKIKLMRYELEDAQHCNLMLIQDEKGREKAQVSDNWKLVWQGKRTRERRESFRLFQHV